MHIATIITTIAVIGSAVATVWLATATKKLASGTDSLVQVTKTQGEQNSAADLRSYSLTLHQINLQSKANVYEDALKYFFDDFNNIQELAQFLSIPFDPKAFGKSLVVNEKAAFSVEIINKISLHGSLSIGIELAAWIDKVQSLRDLLQRQIPNASPIDVYSLRSQIQDPGERDAVTTEFTTRFEALKDRYSELIVKMREELHPSE